MSVRSSRGTVWLLAVLAAALLLGSGLPLFAEDSSEDSSKVSLADAIRDGKALLNVRYRYEFVDESGWTKDANASTIRAQIGYQTAKWNGLWALAEYQGNFAAQSDQRYNSTGNGQLQFPVVADPVGPAIR